MLEIELFGGCVCVCVCVKCFIFSYLIGTFELIQQQNSIYAARAVRLKIKSRNNFFPEIHFFMNLEQSTNQYIELRTESSAIIYMQKQYLWL